MDKIEILKHYFEKLSKLIEFSADLQIFQYGIYKKTLIDDILCCILPSIPQSYKNLGRVNPEKVSSFVFFKKLQELLTNRNILCGDSNYVINKDEAIKLIKAILTTLERDIIFAERGA